MYLSQVFQAAGAKDQLVGFCRFKNQRPVRTLDSKNNVAMIVKNIVLDMIIKTSGRLGFATLAAITDVFKTLAQTTRPCLESIDFNNDVIFSRLLYR